MESAAYWILEQLGEEDAVIDELNEFIHGLAGREVTEDDLATFLGYAGFVEDPTEAARIPTGNAVSEALATLIRNGLSTQGELQELGQHRVKDLAQPEHIFRSSRLGFLASFLRFGMVSR